MKCTTCTKESSKTVKFPCPTCGHEIVRCEKCRSLSIEYICSKCKHEGP